VTAFNALLLFSVLLGPARAEGGTPVNPGKNSSSFTLDFDPALFEPASRLEENHRGFVEWIRSRIDPDPYRLLRRQKELYSRHGFESEVPKFDLVLERQLGAISGLSRLDALLMSFHFDRYSPRAPAEFLALILRKEDKLKIHYVSSGDPFVSDEPSIEKDLEDGWRLLIHLHNHLFFFDNPEDIAGTVVPSGDPTFGDVGTYRRWAKRLGYPFQVRITNGIDTWAAPSRELSRLDPKQERPAKPELGAMGRLIQGFR
jgi:hypothetical protein